MKSTKVQTFGEQRKRDTANWWAGLEESLTRASYSSR